MGKRLVEKGCGKHQLSKASLIKYDKRQMKQNFVLTVILGVLTALSWLFVGGVFDVSDYMTDFMFVVLFFFYVCSGPAFIYTLYQLVSGVNYMHRLKKHGYAVPEDKRKYDSLLEKLPCQKITNKDTAKRRNKASFSLGVVSLCTLLLLGICSILYIVEWSFFHKEIIFMIGMMTVTDIALLVYCVMFFRQADETRYKDDVEPDSNRKNRMPLIDGSLTLFILLFFFLFAKYEAHTATEYIFKSRVSTDISLIQSIQYAFDSAYESMEVVDADATDVVSINELMKGVDITTWGTPRDVFQLEVASMIGVSDFSELQDDFYTTEGKAVVYVKLEEEQFVVELCNQVEKAKNPDEWMWIKR